MKQYYLISYVISANTSHGLQHLYNNIVTDETIPQFIARATSKCADKQTVTILWYKEITEIEAVLLKQSIK